jgi:uncharacterized protein YjbJ (UPF0337 family)
MTKGMFHEVRGTAKKIVGALFSSRTLGAKGRIERLTGKFHRKIGKLQGMCGY